MASPTPVKTLRTVGPIIVLILVVVAALLGYYQLVYYPKIAPTSTTTTTTSSSVGPLEKSVTIVIPNGAQDPSTPTSLSYIPDVATVYIGYNATVIWYNNDSAEHTVTAKPNAPDPKFNQFGPTSAASYNIVNPGASVTFTFTIVGNYSYYCSFHSWMAGQVIVKTAPPGLVNSTTSVTSTKTTSST